MLKFVSSKGYKESRSKAQLSQRLVSKYLGINLNKETCSLEKETKAHPLF